MFNLTRNRGNAFKMAVRHYFTSIGLAKHEKVQQLMARMESNGDSADGYN